MLRLHRVVRLVGLARVRVGVLPCDGWLQYGFQYGCERSGALTGTLRLLIAEDGAAAGLCRPSIRAAGAAAAAGSGVAGGIASSAIAETETSKPTPCVNT